MKKKKKVGRPKTWYDFLEANYNLNGFAEDIYLAPLKRHVSEKDDRYFLIRARLEGYSWKAIGWYLRMSPIKARLYHLSLLPKHLFSYRDQRKLFSKHRRKKK